MTGEPYRVAIVGCGRMGQHYAEVYQTLPDTELVAIAAKYSALWGNVPVSLPLEERFLTLYPRAYRRLGGDQSGKPQCAAEAAVNTQLA